MQKYLRAFYSYRIFNQIKKFEPSEFVEKLRWRERFMKCILKKNYVISHCPVEEYLMKDETKQTKIQAHILKIHNH